jgi:adenylate cyclase
VSAGLVFAGDIGAQERLEYTVIGDPVNEAARLSELAKSQDGRVVASECAVRSAMHAEGLRWDIGELVELRGRTTPTRVARPAVLTGARAVEMSA